MLLLLIVIMLANGNRGAAQIATLDFDSEYDPIAAGDPGTPLLDFGLPTHNEESSDAAVSSQTDDLAYSTNVSFFDEYPVRLLGGASETEGRVEILFYGIWGSVCSDGWDPTDASAVCRQLGFLGHNTSVITNSYDAGFSQNAMISDVRCHGTENRLSDCAFTGWGVYCANTDYAGVVCQFDDDFAIRLSGGTSEKNGNVEVLFRDQWGSVCDANFTISDVNVLCRELGFNGTSAAFTRNPGYFDVINLNNPECIGNEISLADCAAYSWGKGYQHDCLLVGIHCEIDSDEDFLSVRLTYGLSENQGRLEMFVNGQWVGVTDSGWDDAATSVVCRQLGFIGPNVTVHKSFFGWNNGPKYQSKLICNGDEEHLSDCKNLLFDSSWQGIFEDVGVMCIAVDNHPIRFDSGSYPTGGIVQVFLNGYWANVCVSNDGLSKEAVNVICRQLGYFGRGVTLDLSVREVSSYYYAIDNINCNGTEVNITDCDVDHWGVDVCPVYFAGVFCDAGDFPIRLVGGTSSSNGWVEIFFNGQWGTVCADGWDQLATSVVCRQLGLHGPNETLYTANDTNQLNYLTNVACTGNEQRLIDCLYTGFLTECRLLAGVMCQHDTEDYPVRLVGSNSTLEGLVEIFYMNHWRPIDDYGWGKDEARVVCRHLGLHGPSLAVADTSSTQAMNPSVRNMGLSCSGDEAKLADCSYNLHIEVALSVYRGAVVCSTADSVGESTPIRLVSGLNAYSGFVQLYFNGHWGYLLDAKLDQNDASVLCRHLGFGEEGYTVQSVRGYGDIQYDAKTYRINITCTGNERRLIDCEQGSTSPWDYDVRQITCQPPDTTFPVRLVHGPTYDMGRVEVHTNGKWWGDTGIYNHDERRLNFANVVCNQLGFNGVLVSLNRNIFGPRRQFCLVSGVRCLGNESRLADCSYRIDDDAVTTCYLETAVVCNADFSAFGDTCQPPEAIRFPNGQPTIVAIVPFGRNSTQVFWTKPTLVNPPQRYVESTYCVAASGAGDFLPCKSGDIFNITSLPVHGITMETSVRYSVTDLDNPDNSFKCTFYISVQDQEQPRIACPASFTLAAEEGSSNVTAYWSEPLASDNSGVVTTESSIAYSPPVILGFGIYDFTYTATDGSMNTNSCSFTVTVLNLRVGPCIEATITDEAYGAITWPVTEPGSQAISVQRCPLWTEKAGHPKSTRTCSSSMLVQNASWESFDIDCGKQRQETSLDNVAQMPIVDANVVEVAEYLAEMISWEGDEVPSLQMLYDVIGILHDIVGVRSGEIQVARAVIDITNGIMGASNDHGSFKSLERDHKTALVSALRVIEDQVSWTLNQEERVSIHREFIHVEALNINASNAGNGLTFVSVHNVSSLGQPPEGNYTLTGSEVKVYDQNSQMQTFENIIAAAQLPLGFDMLLSKTGNLTEPLKVSFILFADDTFFPSTYLMSAESKLTLSGGVVSVAIEGVTPMNLPEPVVVQIKDSTVRPIKVNNTKCVFWDMTLEDGIGDWSDAGCKFDGVTNGIYTCRCDRTAIFAVLVEFQDPLEVYQPPYYLISRISCVGSAATYLIVIVLYFAARRLRRNASSGIFLNFVFSLLLMYAVFFAGVQNTKLARESCMLVAALLQYLPLTAMMWTAIDARNIYTTSLKAIPSTNNRCNCIAGLFAWGAPLAITLATYALPGNLYDNNNCFMSPGLPMYLGLLLPIGLILSHNIITITMATLNLRRHKGEEGETARPSGSVARRLIGAVSIYIMLMITWVSGFLTIHTTALAFPITLSIANCIQVLLILTMVFIHWAEGPADAEAAQETHQEEERDAGMVKGETGEIDKEAGGSSKDDILETVLKEGSIEENDSVPAADA